MNDAILRVSWLDPSSYPPPLGENILLKTKHGRAVIGIWRDDGVFLSWQYLPV